MAANVVMNVGLQVRECLLLLVKLSVFATT